MKINPNFDEKVVYLQLFFEFLDQAGRSSGVLSKMRADFAQALEAADEKLLSAVFKEAQKRVRDTFLHGDKIRFQNQHQSSWILSRVLEKGRIESADEYEILLEHVEGLLEESDVSDEVAQCNKLLAEFVKNKVVKKIDDV